MILQQNLRLAILWFLSSSKVLISLQYLQIIVLMLRMISFSMFRCQKLFRISVFLSALSITRFSFSKQFTSYSYRYLYSLLYFLSLSYRRLSFDRFRDLNIEFYLPMIVNLISCSSSLASLLKDSFNLLIWFVTCSQSYRNPKQVISQRFAQRVDVHRSLQFTRRMYSLLYMRIMPSIKRNFNCFSLRQLTLFLLREWEDFRKPFRGILVAVGWGDAHLGKILSILQIIIEASYSFERNISSCVLQSLSNQISISSVMNYQKLVFMITQMILLNNNSFLAHRTQKRSFFSTSINCVCTYQKEKMSQLLPALLIILNFPRNSMFREIENYLEVDLKKGKVCTIDNFCLRFSSVSPADMVHTFINFYRNGMNAQYELLCHIVIQKQGGVRIQIERYDNIQRGVVLNYTVPDYEMIQFTKEEVKEFKITAIFPKNFEMALVKQMMEKPKVYKSKKYQNKYVVAPMMRLQSEAIISQNNTDKALKKEAKEQVKEEPKPMFKALKKEEKVVPEKKVTPLSKVTGKEQKIAPVVTSYQNVREKMQTAKISSSQMPKEKEKQPKSRKLMIESDEEPYEPVGFNKLMHNDNDDARQTDGSGKKNTQDQEPVVKHQPMDIEELPKKNESANRFIVKDDDEDEDDDLFAKMDKKAPLKTISQAPLSQSISEKPKAELAKTSSQLSNKAPAPSNKAKASSVPPKGMNTLMSFFTVKPKNA